MNRPLALIEGNLAFPKPRPFDGLPPPFGSGRRTPKPVAQTEAQQAIQAAVQRDEQPARQGTFPPGVKHVLFYKAPPPRSNPHRFDAEMAEAKRYLEMGCTRPRSSRSDYVVGATIFLGCSIALAWLLATCTARDVEKKATTLAVTQPVKASADHPPEPGKLAQLAVKGTQTVAQRAPSDASAVTIASAPRSVAAVPPSASPATSPMAATVVASARSKPSAATAVARPLPTVRASIREAVTSRPAKADRSKVGIARLTDTQVNGKLALGRTVRAATQPAVSKQPEWTARPSSENDTIDQAALLNWATQQRAHVTTRATVPVPGDTDWNTRMTQRRVTDNPDAFQAGRGQK
jgi:hypothetical protein